MLQFNELRITPDNKYLIIDVSVKNEIYYKKVVIDSIVIDTQDTYVSNGPSSKPIYIYTNECDLSMIYSSSENICNPVLEEESMSYCFTEGLESSQHVRLLLSTKDLGVPLDTTMFFVYAIASGTPAPDTPCGLDNSIIMGTVVNLYPFYQNTMKYVNELNDNCQIPKGFIDMILRLKALELSIRTGNYIQAIKSWKRFFGIHSNQVPVTKCRCNG